MNLQEIQKRMGELSAEMLDLSNKMSVIIGVQAVDPKALKHWTQLEVGDSIYISESFEVPYGMSGKAIAGLYKVIIKEGRDYVGRLNVAVEFPCGNRQSWIDVQELIDECKVTRV